MEMNLSKYFKIEPKKNEGKVRELLIVAAFAVILLGFGNGFQGRYTSYEDEDGLNSPPVIPQKKKHKHRHRMDSAKIPPKTATIEVNPEPEKSINSDEVPYIVQ